MSKNTGDGELDEDELCRLASLVGTDARNPEANLVAYVRGAIAQEANKARLMPVSDLAWCLGKLRGLGHPAEHLEKQYGIKNPVIQNKLEGLQ